MTRKKHPIIVAFAEAYWAMEKAVENADEEEFDQLRVALSQLTTTNCWYAEYDVAPLIRSTVEDDRQRRIYVAAQEAADA